MPGERVSHYRILELIGEGGMGVVYKAEDEHLHRAVALKFLKSDDLDEPSQADRFLREAQIAAALNHPNICTVHEVDRSNGAVFIAMEYIDGPTVESVLRERAMSSDEVADIGVQVARALEVAHAGGIVHCDVKNANVMLTRDGRAVVMDFGLATIRGAARHSSEDRISGTLAYMSPEQLRDQEVEERTDVWSLGVCLYEMLAGELPFDAEYETALAYAILNQDTPSLAKLAPGLPFTLGVVVETALSKDPAARYASMAEMRAALEIALAESRGAPAAGERKQTSIAVLPFSDMSEARDQDYFCDGITEEIINDLSQLKMLRVVSRTSSFAFKGKNEDVRVIGRKLGVKCVLEGSVRKHGDHLRITAQLIDVGSGYHVWSHRYDAKTKEVFTIQDNIARSIAEALEIELSETEAQVMHKAATRDIRAYDFYLRGRKLFYQTKRSNIAKAIDMFSRAIEEDPGFARAWAGIANCNSYLYWYFDRSPEKLDSAMDASSKALELDPDLAEAHAARGLALTLNKQYEAAENEYREAVRLSPTLFEAYYFHARTRFVQGDLDGAAKLFEQACAVDPEDHQAPMMLGFVLSALGQLEKSKAVYQRGLANIETHLKIFPEDSRAFYLASSACVGIGDREKALKYSMRAVLLDPDDSYTLYGVACNFARLHEVEESLYYFEKAIRAGFAHRQWIENDKDLDPIRDQPRFQALVGELKD